MDDLKHDNLPVILPTYDDDPLLTTEEAAAYLGLAPSTLATWRVRRSDGPRFLKIGRKVLYPRSELKRFRAECMRTSTSG